MRLSSAQQEIIRTRPQQTKAYLTIFQPKIVFQAQINDASITKGARVITFDSVSLGSYTSIVGNSMMWIGTTAGAQDVGKIRVRSATSSQITVSENDNISWVDRLFLTVFYFIELNPVYPRIIQDPSNVENVLFFKDYDIAYTNQNNILGTFVCAGPHRGAFAGEQLYYSSTGTYNLVGATLNYNWTFEGGSPSSSSSANPGFVTYNTAGDYVTCLQVSGSNGAVDTTYRYVSIRDRIGQGSNPPLLKWEVSGLGGSRDEGGYKANFKVYQDINVQENAVVVIFTDDWYGNQNISLGGNYPNASKIFYVGYIMEDSIHYDYQHSYVEFSTSSLTGLMKDALGFSVSVESKASPSKWYELLDMDCRRAIYHYLRWHTTALNIGDFQFVGDDRKIQFFDADRNSMYDAIDNLMRDTLIGKSVSDRQGKTWMEVDAKAYPNPTGTFTSVMDISKRDWMNEPSIDEQLSDSLSYLEYGGIAYSGTTTGTFSAILAAAPGNTPSFRGKIETHEGLALLGQAQLNTLVGNVWANENSPYPKVGMELGIDARNLDIAPQETTNLVILPNETVRGIGIQGLYIPSGMDWKYDPKNSILLPNIDFTNLVNGVDGETIEIATDASGIDNGFNVPGLQIPPLPPLAFPPFTPTGLTDAQITTVINNYAGVYADVGLHDGTSSTRVVGGISISTNTSTTIALTNFPTATYLLLGNFSINFAPIGSPGDEKIVTMQMTSGGGATVIAEGDQEGVVTSTSGLVVNGSCSTIRPLSPSSLITLSLGGGIGGITIRNFNLIAVRIGA